MDKQSIVMNEQSIAMSEQRWLEIVDKVGNWLNDGYWVEGCVDLSEEECKLVVSVLKNNIPFDVVSDLSDNEVKL